MTINGEAGRPALIIDVLLHEYDTLRAEILARANSRFQLLGFAGVVVALLGATHNITLIIIVSVALAVAAVVIWIGFHLYINKCAARLMEIEARVNALFPEDVLVWESRSLRPSWRDVFKASAWHRATAPPLAPGQVIAAAGGPAAQRDQPSGDTSATS